MLEVLMRNRRWLLLRGYTAIVFGLLVVVWPGLTAIVLLVLYGAYALVDGIASLLLVRRGSRAPGAEFAALMAVAIFGIIAGGNAFFWAGYSSMLLHPTPIPPLIVLAAWAVARGAFEAAAGMRLRRQLEGEWLLGAAGLLSIAFGVVLVLQAILRLLGLVWFVGIYAFAAGIFYIALGTRLGKLEERFRPDAPTPDAKA